MKLRNPSLDQVIRNAITVTDSMTLLEAREVLLKRRVGRLPVLDKNKKPVGIITEKDFVRAIYKFSGKQVGKILVRDFMSKNLITITRKNDIYDCAKLMRSHKISSVLVLDGSTLAGIITKTDIASVFLTQSGTDSAYANEADENTKTATKSVII